jgi:hypothetical protein
MWRNFGVWVAAVVLTGGGGSIVATATVADDPYTIAFGSFASVRPTVFIADGNGEHILPLLTNPDVVGDRMVCNSGIAGIAHNAILMMNADGSNRRVLFNDPERSAVAPASSPRGDRIAFALGQFFPMVPGREQVKSQPLPAIAQAFRAGRRTASGWSTGRRTRSDVDCESSISPRIG